MTQLPAILTTEEAAAAIRVHPETLRRWVREGKVAAIELPSGTLRFKAAAIEQMLSGDSPVADAGMAAPQLLARAAFLLTLTGLMSLMAFNAPTGTPLALLLAVGAWYALVRLLGAGALAVGRHQRAGGGR